MPPVPPVPAVPPVPPVAPVPPAAASGLFPPLPAEYSSDPVAEHAAIAATTKPKPNAFTGMPRMLLLLEVG
ncbi:MAG: hypothetical protein CVU63_19895 [Deltaproteobacteria bacterium HGW-Deltaproteobacteria-20]|nr:MAG: hypothetical protein CVU63_19895 [Deltaproteobacteria bacterium HGW-Deltaproteobacteria-20]